MYVYSEHLALVLYILAVVSRKHLVAARMMNDRKKKPAISRCY